MAGAKWRGEIAGANCRERNGGSEMAGAKWRGEMAGQNSRGRNREAVKTVLSPGAFEFYRLFARKRFRSCLNVYYPAVSVFLESIYMISICERSRLRAVTLSYYFYLLFFSASRRIAAFPFAYFAVGNAYDLSYTLSAPSSQCNYFLQAHAPLPCKTF